MGKLCWFFVVFAASMSITCSEIDNIDITVEGNTTVPQRTIIDELLGEISFLGFDGFDIEQSQEFQNQGYSKSDVDSVVLKSFTLTITSPQGGNFDFLNDISFFVDADGLERRRIAFLDPIPRGQSQLTLDVVADVELQPYIISESMTIDTEANGLRPEEETQIAAAVVLDVDVNVAGVLGCD